MMKYLGFKATRPRIAVFDFTGCEGCELQLANKEETLVDFIKAVEVVNFREVSSESSDAYDIALIEGAITREDEVERLKRIRKRASVLVALGSCACFGGVNRLKNQYDLDDANLEVYGSMPKDTLLTRAIKEVVSVDLSIPGCPINKSELESIVKCVVLDIPFRFPAYPVCVECKQRFTVCMFELGQLCLGPITRAGCNAPCPASGLGCWGCRGPAEALNMDGFIDAAGSLGFKEREMRERLDMFGGFEGIR
jgi:coenzyme F420-reducing hydrogenase gamma subunit